MHFTCRSFIGSHDDSGWSQYWENEQDNPLILSQKGRLFGLITLSSNKNSNLNSIGHEIISTINQKYFFDSQTNIKTSLENISTSVLQNLLYADIEISLSIAIFIKNKIYFCVFGPGEIILNRSNRICRIVSGRPNSFIVISGPVFLNDKILLATSVFYEKFSWEKIKSFLTDENIQNIEENFLSTLYSFNDQTGLSAVLVKVEADEIKNPVNQGVSDIQQKSFKKKINFPKINFSFFKKIFFKKPVYVSRIETSQISKRKKLNLFFAVFLLLGLGFSIFLGYKKSLSLSSENQYATLKKELDKKLSDGFAIKNLNFDSALELAKQSQEIYSKMKNLKIHSDELLLFQDKIQSLLSQTGATNSLLKNIFYDTSLIVDNPKFFRILLKKNYLYLLDRSSGRLDAVDVNQKNIKNISSNEKLKLATGLTENNNDIYLIDDKSVFLADKDKIDIKIDFSKMNKNISQIDLKSWNGAFYLLDSFNSTIWKFNPNASGFGSGEIWLKDNKKIDNPSSLAINGNIWVLSKNGEISSFIRGVKDNFKQSQIPKADNAKSLVVGIENIFLAFVGNDNLIYVFKKTGELTAKYNFDDKKILDISMDEKSNSLFALCDDQKIYKINL